MSSSSFQHPRMVNLNVTCNTEAEVIRVFEVLARMAAGLTVDGYDTELGSYSFSEFDDDDDELARNEESDEEDR